MASVAMSPSQEWRTYWPLVLAATIGFSFHSVVTYSTGLFIEPLSREFGWSRAQITAGLSIAAVLSVPLSPLVGAMIDRWGTRRLALPGMIMTMALMTAFGFATGSTVQWLALWTIYAIVSLGIKSTIWTVAISGCFAAGRGFALAVTLCGTAVAQTVVPILSQWLIEAFGWRQAYMWLAIGWGGPALILAGFFLYDARDRNRLARVKGQQASAEDLSLPGLSVREALRSVPLLRIGVATLFTMVLGIAVIVHQVPILTEAGVTREYAAYLAGLSGIAAIFGKLITGWLMDRVDAGIVGGATMAIAAVAFLLLLEPFRAPAMIVISMMIIGYSGGAKLQICAYLTSRYAGMRNFGKIFGVMASIIALGAGLGPMLAGAVYDVYGSYSPLIIVGIPGSLIAGLLLIGMGPYPDWSGRTASPAPQRS